MKSVFVVAVALFAVAFAYPKPAEVVTRDDDDDSKEETEFVRVPLQRGHHENRPPSFGFGLSLPGLFTPPPSFAQDPFFRASPWGGLQPQGADGEEVDDVMTQMQEMLKEMRKQLTTLVQHAHHHHGVEGGEDGSVGTRIGDGDLPKNETTSVTKVVDGHVVTVNETTYSSGDDGMGVIFKIKVLEVVPQQTPEDSTHEGPSASEAPPAENETVNKSELDEDNHEETNEIPKTNMKVLQYEWSPEFDPSVNEIEQPDVDTVVQFKPIEKEKYHDLSGDTKVNDYLSDQAESQGLVMIDPDAELIGTDTNSYYHYEQPQRVQRFP